MPGHLRLFPIAGAPVRWQPLCPPGSPHPLCPGPPRASGDSPGPQAWAEIQTPPPALPLISAPVSVPGSWSPSWPLGRSPHGTFVHRVQRSGTFGRWVSRPTALLREMAILLRVTVSRFIAVAKQCNTPHRQIWGGIAAAALVQQLIPVSNGDKHQETRSCNIGTFSRLEIRKVERKCQQRRDVVAL